MAEHSKPLERQMSPSLQIREGLACEPIGSNGRRTSRAMDRHAQRQSWHRIAAAFQTHVLVPCHPPLPEPRASTGSLGPSVVDNADRLTSSLSGYSPIARI